MAGRDCVREPAVSEQRTGIWLCRAFTEGIRLGCLLAGKRNGLAALMDREGEVKTRAGSARSSSPLEQQERIRQLPAPPACLVC